MKKMLLMLLTSGIILSIVMSAFSVAAEKDGVSDEDGKDSDEIRLPPIPPAQKPVELPTEAPCDGSGSDGQDGNDPEEDTGKGIPPIPPGISSIISLLAARFSFLMSLLM